MAAGFWDVFSLLLTSAFIIGVVVGIIIIPRKYREGVNAAKASLAQRGWQVSNLSREDAGGGGGRGGHVVALKSNKKRMMDREQYLDATQRGLMRAVNASHFGAPQDACTRRSHSHSHSHSANSSTCSLHEGSAHLSALHSMLRYHHDHRHDHDHQDGAGAGGISDSGSDTASIDGAPAVAGMSALPEEPERRHRHPHLGRLKHLVR